MTTQFAWRLEDIEFLDLAEKHLPGDHDQSTHGNWATGGPPDHPREPAGDSDGGQFTEAGGGGSGEPERFVIDLRRGFYPGVDGGDDDEEPKPRARKPSKVADGTADGMLKNLDAVDLRGFGLGWSVKRGAAVANMHPLEPAWLPKGWPEGKAVKIDALNTSDRSKPFDTMRLMRTITEAADAEGVTLTLNAQPFSTQFMRAEEIALSDLKRFYRRYGFSQPRKGNANFVDYDTMVRPPRTAAQKALDEAFMLMRGERHGDDHDQSDHGNWARGGGALPAPGTARPPKVGAVPVPEGMVRVFHYIGSNMLHADPRAMLTAILKEGLRTEHAQGHTYGEPDQVWASFTRPDSGLTYVEIAVRPDEVDIGGPSPGVTYPQGRTWAEQAAAVGSNITLKGDVPPERILTYSEPWMRHYDYLQEDPAAKASVIAGEFDGPMFQGSDYGPAIALIKREAAGGEKALGDALALMRGRKHGDGSHDESDHGNWATGGGSVETVTPQDWADDWRTGFVAMLGSMGLTKDAAEKIAGDTVHLPKAAVRVTAGDDQVYVIDRTGRASEADMQRLGRIAMETVQRDPAPHLSSHRPGNRLQISIVEQMSIKDAPGVLGSAGYHGQDIEFKPRALTLERGNRGEWMPAADEGDILRYLVAHEYGHIRASAKYGRPDSFDRLPRFKAESKYARSDKHEAYAEGYAQWVLDKSVVPELAGVAKEEGWPGA